jgi:hypothetical protein
MMPGALTLAATQTRALLSSLFYLPALFVLMVLDKVRP